MKWWYIIYLDLNEGKESTYAPARKFRCGVNHGLVNACAVERLEDQTFSKECAGRDAAGRGLDQTKKGGSY